MLRLWAPIWQRTYFKSLLQQQQWADSSAERRLPTAGPMPKGDSYPEESGAHETRGTEPADDRASRDARWISNGISRPTGAWAQFLTHEAPDHSAVDDAFSSGVWLQPTCASESSREDRAIGSLAFGATAHRWLLILDRIFRTMTWRTWSSSEHSR